MEQFTFQIMSDVHLETPKSRPSYDDFEIRPQCSCLALLGDIGNVSNPKLFAFLERQLLNFPLVLYVLGNHEPYGMTHSDARIALETFETNINEQRRRPSGERLGQFVFLNKRRYDCSERLTVLGCTLFSSIRLEQRESVARFVSDFSKIDDWDIDAHNSAHQREVQWLNSQISECTHREPHRSIVVLTHYSPTVLEAANDPRHTQDDAGVQSAFVTDLSNQVCWTCPQVRLWAFGHTHYNCDFVDVQTGKRVVANQKGYRRAEVVTFDEAKVVRLEIPLTSKEVGTKDDVLPVDTKGKRKGCVVS